MRAQWKILRHERRMDSLLHEKTLKNSIACENNGKLSKLREQRKFRLHAKTLAKFSCMRGPWKVLQYEKTMENSPA
jgi:hypothetical protein